MKAVAWGLVAVSMLSAEVRADPRDPAAAQAMFDAGMSLMKARDYARACPKLAESQRLDPGIGTQFQLGVCYEGQGLTASAWAQFLEVASLASASGQADRQQMARKRAERLEPRLARVRINVPSAKRVAGLHIERDGALVRDVSWDAALPVDPGEHQITAGAPGYLSFAAKVVVQEGRTSDVEIPKLEEEVTDSPPIAPSPAPTRAPAPVQPAVAPAPAPAALRAPEAATTKAPASDSPPSSGMGAAAIGLGSLGFIGLGVGTVLAIMANSKFQDSKGQCAVDNEDRCNATGVKLRDDSISLANVSTAGFIVGGAALTGATVILLVRGASKQSAGSGAPLTAAVQGGPAGGGIVLRGSF